MPSAPRDSVAEPILLDGEWRPAAAIDTYRAIDPTTGQPRDALWPTSGWSDVDAALDAATRAADALRRLPAAALGRFLARYAERLEARGSELVALAHAETGLLVKPRLAEHELPRMVDQLRQAALAATEETWRMATIDTARNIRAAAFGLGPVVIFPPANFPLAYGAVTGGDFAAAIAGGNPVIAKAHAGHPSVSRLAASEAVEALRETGLPPATVQLVHGLAPADGERLVADVRVGGTGFTGSQQAGEKLFAAAAATGRVIWLEMGSINPVVVLPGALTERGEEIAEQLTASVTGSAGQVCIKPSIVFFVDGSAAEGFVGALCRRFGAVGPQVLLGPSGHDRLVDAVGRLHASGARILVGGTAGDGRCTFLPTLLEVTAAQLVANRSALLVEAFGNVTLLVRCASLEELRRALEPLEGALAACFHAARDGSDDEAARGVLPLLVARAGRVVENRMTTGISVSPAMQHGGPWPSAAPPFFSAVGMPWSILRFARRICFDGWSQERLPECLQDAPPSGRPWRFIDGGWSRG
jgi:alpha-ketoglutaric semialdehyde dehydrogenase